MAIGVLSVSNPTQFRVLSSTKRVDPSTARAARPVVPRPAVVRRRYYCRSLAPITPYQRDILALTSVPILPRFLSLPAPRALPERLEAL